MAGGHTPGHSHEAVNCGALGFRSKRGQAVCHVPRLVLCGACPLDMLSSGLAVDNISTAHQSRVDGFAKHRSGRLVATQAPQNCFESPHSPGLDTACITS